MPSRRDHEALFVQARTAFTNARSDADLQAALAPFGYDDARLAAGLAAVDAAEEAARTQQVEYAEQFDATRALNTAAAALRAGYVRHVTLARVAFPRDAVGYAALGLSGERRTDLPGVLAQARTFYRTLLDSPDLLAATSALTLDEAAARAALTATAEVEAARAAQARETGEAQVATRLRDDAVSRLRGFWQDFVAVAKVALADQPQLRETLGLLERS